MRVVVAGWEPWSCQATLCWRMLCWGCWHVHGDVAYLGAVTAGGGVVVVVVVVVVEVRVRTLSVLPYSGWCCKVSSSSAARGFVVENA